VHVEIDNEFKEVVVILIKIIR